MNPITTVSLSRDSSLILYADDIVFYRPIRTLSDVKALQSDVDKLSNWVRTASVTINTSKTKVMIFSCKRTPPTLNLRVDSIAISVVTTFLGVTVTSDLKWNTHISSTCTKARQQLGFLYHFFYMADSVCLSHLYIFSEQTQAN